MSPRTKLSVAAIAPAAVVLASFFLAVHPVTGDPRVIVHAVVMAILLGGLSARMAWMSDQQRADAAAARHEGRAIRRIVTEIDGDAAAHMAARRWTKIACAQRQVSPTAEER